MAGKRKVGTVISSILNGDMLERDFLVRYTPFLICAVILSILYIANGYMVSSIEKQNIKLEREIKEARAEYVSTEKIVIEKTKYINIQEQIKERGMGLRPLQNPAFTIAGDGSK